MWRFAELQKGMPEKHSQEAEFFRLENPSEALVREVIQNSLDAKLDSEEKVKVSFKFGTVSKNSIEPFLYGLIPHLRACDLWSDSQLTLFTEDDTVPYLLIEDFGTTGLDGNISQADNQPSNFYDFWWREGISSKKGSKAGKWGLGKNTLHMASKIRTFFGLTVRADDKKEILMGKASLKTHIINDKKYIESGYYCDNDFIPICDRNKIDVFKYTFCVDRDYETGLSLVIPYIDDEINAYNIVWGCIKHFFYPILKGKLIIEIKNEDNIYLLNNDTLIASSLSLNNDQTFEFLNFAVSTLRKKCVNVICDKDYNINFKDSDKTLEEIRTEYLNGNTIGFKIYFCIQDINYKKYPTFVNVYIKRYEKINSELFWFRSGIRIIEVKNNVKNYPILGLFSADDKTISEFLSSAETPAHTDWNERSEDLKKKYKNYRDTLQFIKNIFHNLIQLIDKPPEDIQYDALKHIFVVPPENNGQTITIGSGEGVNKEINGRNIPVFKIDKIQSGFKVSFSNEYKKEYENKKIKTNVIIKVAYDRVKGNPFRKYEIYDFDFSNDDIIKITIDNGKINNKKANILEIETESLDFYLEVTGFDIKRDIVINADVIINDNNK